MNRATVLTALAALAVPAAAWGHAFLDRADPRVGATVAASPPRLLVHFTQPLEPAFSTVAVSDADGKRVDAGDARPDPQDPATLTVGLPPLTAGTYRVEWRVTSVDTHRTHGSFTFTVQPKG